MRRPPEHIAVPLLKLAIMLFVGVAVSLTVLQCLSVFRSRESTITSKMCLAAELHKVDLPWWLHDSALLGAARLRAMLTLDPHFDIAVLASVSDTDRLVQSITHNCHMSQIALSDGWEWPLLAAGTIFRLTRFDRKEEDGALYHRSLSSAEEVFDPSDVFPVVRCALGEAQFKCPKNEHVFLTKAFGPEWKSAPIVSLL